MPDVALILRNGTVLTMDGDEPVQAVAVDGEGRIAAVGTDADLAGLTGAGVREIDLRGNTLIPGFFDCHMHIGWLGDNLGHVDLSSPPVQTADDVVRLLRERLEANHEAECIQGNRYDQNKLSPSQHLTRHDLDRVSASLPVRIVHTSGHAAVVNSRALELLGITRETPDPAGGEIERDHHGEPTGLLLETATWSHLDRILPAQSAADKITAAARANRYLLKRGITSASDANTHPDDIEVYAAAVADGTLRVRTNLMVNWAELAARAGDGEVPTPNDLQPTLDGLTWHRLHVGQAKLFSDGAITTRTCWLTQSFVGMPDNYGLPLHPPDELRDLILSAHRAGWQIATHAIGDRAIDLVLSAYAEAQRIQTRPRPGHRIEHCMLLDHELIARLRRQNVWSIGQPEFLAGLGDAYVAALGAERADRLSPYATLETQGVAQAFSSDCPVVPGAPLAGIRAAMERRTPSGRILNSAERLSAEAALYAYTAAPAYATRTERDRGSIRIGKWADFTLLTADPIRTPLSEWDRIDVAATFIGGECCHGQENIE